jgi:Flp pilus assembly protein TadD
VHFHLGAILKALGRADVAREALEHAIDVAGDRPLPQMETARALLDELGDG